MGAISLGIDERTTLKNNVSERLLCAQSGRSHLNQFNNIRSMVYLIACLRFKTNSKMKNYQVCAVTLLILFVGCAPKVWHKDGAVQNDYKRDRFACKKKANEGGWGTRNLFNLCMSSKGYSLIKK